MILMSHPWAASKTIQTTLLWTKSSTVKNSQERRTTEEILFTRVKTTKLTFRNFCADARVMQREVDGSILE